ncbi:MAG: hypothetical protein ACPLRX_10450 [Candidatus Saccharicenans sp.]
MKRIIWILLILLAAGCSKTEKTSGKSTEAVTSGEITAKASPASYYSLCDSLKASLENSDYKNALEIINSLKDELWEKVPLSLQNIKYVKGPDNTYGVYEPAEDDIFADGETIYLYAEPVGYKIIKNEDGFYEFGFKADFQLVSENGEVLGSQENFATLNFKSWHPNKEVAITFNFNFSGISAGRYQIITTVHDENSDKKTFSKTWFRIK